jgi:hypothetical protein
MQQTGTILVVLVFCSTLSEFENFLLCERILISVLVTGRTTEAKLLTVFCVNVQSRAIHFGHSLTQWNVL